MSGVLSSILHRGIPNLVVSQRVIDKMAEAARSFIEDETGEAMVGLVAPGGLPTAVPTLYVLDTIAPDDSAVRQFHTFQQGDERQDELIWWLQENWHTYRQRHQDKEDKPLATKWDVPLRYLGDWHKQPGDMIQPSQGDLMTARRWIEDPDNHMEFLLAPIVTVGYAPSEVNQQSGSTNFVAVSQGETSMRVDFWYIDRKNRDFMPITPTIYPAAQLPGLPEYPWHLTDEERFKSEYGLLGRDGMFTSLVLWDADGKPPLEICFLTARVGSDKVLILVTPWNYPKANPTARVAPFVHLGDNQDIYDAFESMWKQSQPVADPPDWTWAEGRHLLDYVYALEDSLGMRRPSVAKADEEEKT
jgi:hypothetical protein